MQHNYVIILMVTRVYFKNFNQRINVITALKPHLSESIMTFFKAVDDNKFVILLLLDLSAAFDTVDHTILVSRLAKRLYLQ